MDVPVALARRCPGAAGGSPHGDAADAAEALAALERTEDLDRHLDIGPAAGFDRLGRVAEGDPVALIGCEIAREVLDAIVVTAPHRPGLAVAAGLEMIVIAAKHGR